MFARQAIGFILFVASLGVRCAGVCASSPVEGFTEPSRTIEVAASEAGIVATIDVQRGQSVVVGQVLATLDRGPLTATRSIAAARAASHAQFDLAQAELQLRQRRLQKLRELSATGHARPDELERAEADLSVAQANLLAAREENAIARLELERIDALLEQRTVRSPIAATVTEIDREVSEFIPAHEPRLLTLVDLGALRVRFSVPWQLASPWRTGDEVHLELPDANQSVPGRIDYVAPLADAESGTVRIDVVLENRERQHACGARCLWTIDERSASRERPPVRGEAELAEAQ